MCQTSFPDIYEGYPYYDDAGTTTLNILSAGVPQDHTLHGVEDVDWGIVYQADAEATRTYYVELTSLTIPTDTYIRLDVYIKGIDNASESNVFFPGEDLTIGWKANVIDSIYYSVQVIWGEVPSELQYTVTFSISKETGAHNGLTSAVGSSRMIVRWEVPGSGGRPQAAPPPSSSQGISKAQEKGFHVMGAASLAEEYTQLNTELIPFPTGTGSSWLEFVHEGLAPRTLSFYRILLVDTDGSVSLWAGPFYGITDFAGLTTVAFEESASAALESETAVQIPVNLSEQSNDTVTVIFAVTGGDAEGGNVDFVLNDGPLTFLPGDTRKTIDITLRNDDVTEETESIVITLHSADNAVVGDPSVHTFSILNDDAGPAVIDDDLWILYP